MPLEMQTKKVIEQIIFNLNQTFQSRKQNNRNYMNGSKIKTNCLQKNKRVNVDLNIHNRCYSENPYSFLCREAGGNPRLTLYFKSTKKQRNDSQKDKSTKKQQNIEFFPSENIHEKSRMRSICFNKDTKQFATEQSETTRKINISNINEGVKKDLSPTRFTFTEHFIEKPKTTTNIKSRETKSIPKVDHNNLMLLYSSKFGKSKWKKMKNKDGKIMHVSNIEMQIENSEIEEPKKETIVFKAKPLTFGHLRNKSTTKGGSILPELQIKEKYDYSKINEDITLIINLAKHPQTKLDNIRKIEKTFVRKKRDYKNEKITNNNPIFNLESAVIARTSTRNKMSASQFTQQ